MLHACTESLFAAVECLVRYKSMFVSVHRYVKLARFALHAASDRASWSRDVVMIKDNDMICQGWGIQHCSLNNEKQAPTPRSSSPPLLLFPLPFLNKPRAVAANSVNADTVKDNQELGVLKALL